VPSVPYAVTDSDPHAVQDFSNLAAKLSSTEL